jgi:tetratricopeptide (TPR) repeat protein
MGDPTPMANQVASAMSLQAQQYSDAIALAQKAIASDSNDPDGYLTLSAALSFTGKPREAAELVERAMRLNPHYPPRYLYLQGLAQFGMQRFDATTQSLERAIALDHDDYWSQRLLLATYGLLGRKQGAAKLIDSMQGKDKRGRWAYQDPITIKAIAYWYPFEMRSDSERFAEGLRKAGVPE